MLESTGLTIYPLPYSGKVSIGRGDDCDIRIADALASRHHATLYLEPLSLVDDDSANGTRLGSHRLSPGVREQCVLGQAIGIGNAILIVRAASPAATRAQSARWATPPPIFD